MFFIHETEFEELRSVCFKTCVRLDRVQDYLNELSGRK